MRYGACPSCQTMMYKIKKQADNSDVRFASLRGETCGGRADEMLDKLIKIKRSNPAEHRLIRITLRDIITGYCLPRDNAFSLNYK